MSYLGKRTPLAVRLWKKVDRRGPDDCWPWIGKATVGEGYGTIMVWADATTHYMTTAHRVALELKLGRTLESWERACHSCDNPPCCNPKHLFLGTQGDNLDDMRQKGRRGRTGPPGGQLDPDKVREIRRLRATGCSQQAIADAIGVAQTTIGRVLSGELWAHVE